MPEHEEKIMERKMPKKTVVEEFEAAHIAGKVSDEEYERVEEIHLDIEREKAKEAILKKVR